MHHSGSGGCGGLICTKTEALWAPSAHSPPVSDGGSGCVWGGDLSQKAASLFLLKLHEIII